MKKLLALLLAAAMIFALVSCGADKAENVTVRVAALKGPTGMGMVQLMENDSLGTTKNNYEFTIAASPEEVSAAVIAGKIDIAAVPVNLASVLVTDPYNLGIEIRNSFFYHDYTFHLGLTLLGEGEICLYHLKMTELIFQLPHHFGRRHSRCTNHLDKQRCGID